MEKTTETDNNIYSFDSDLESLRNRYELLQEIKAGWQIERDRMQCIRKLIQYLNDFDDRDNLEIRNTIIDRGFLDSMVKSHANEGASSIKVFLSRYDEMSQDDYYYLNGYGNIEMLDSDKVDLFLDSVENVGGFKEILTYEHSRNYMHEIEGNEKEDLIAICQKNGWLKYDGYEFQDGSFSEEEYGYNYLRCERCLDLMNHLEHVSWAIRDGFLFKDMAFIQQVNGGDEYWTLINHNGEWIDYESVTFRPSIERGEFYALIEKLHEEGIQAIQRDMKKIRKKGGLDERQT